VLVLDTILVFLFISLLRLGFRLFREWLELSLNQAQGETRILILGAGDMGERLVRQIRQYRSDGQNVIGFLDDEGDKIGRFIHGVEVLGPTASLVEVIEHYEIDKVYCTTEGYKQYNDSKYSDLREIVPVPVFQAVEAQDRFSLNFEAI